MQSEFYKYPATNDPQKVTIPRMTPSTIRFWGCTPLTVPSQNLNTFWTFTRHFTFKPAEMSLVTKCTGWPYHYPVIITLTFKSSLLKLIFDTVRTVISLKLMSFFCERNDTVFLLFCSVTAHNTNILFHRNRKHTHTSNQHEHTHMPRHSGITVSP